MAQATQLPEQRTQTNPIDRVVQSRPPAAGSIIRPAMRANAYRLAMRVLPLIPPPFAYWFCERLSLLGQRVSVWPRVQRNLGYVVPGETPSTYRRLGLAVMAGLLKNYYDLLRSHAVSAAELAETVETRGLDNLLAALARGKGVLVAVPHMGNVQLAAEPIVARVNTPILTIVEKMQDPAIHAIMNGLRRRENVSVVEIGPESAREVVRTLRAGNIVVLASDRTVAGATVEVKFFGATARVPSGPALLALRTGASLLTAYTYRQPDNRSVVVVDPPLVPERTGDLQADVQRTMQAVMYVLESYIRSRPAQWLMTESVWVDE
ncbi:MAG: hypothetical protein AVDCRST_MAG26-2120 [uncultured Chloroflexia bacterium]|uniref:Lysophospholipid acyltransferase family protein n=1 Tax=uncultured Chloroflexia bacterium TaxID=1672391 RepID=A0A6J4IM33_9CHLR|nr:MAG: hypothetical protein AVDCRST_MAG26-2120 [uncultured Chloroflexia bacterium]